MWRAWQAKGYNSGFASNASFLPASAMTNATQVTPKIGFVSLGCPKALVDSEQILTQLRAEGYDTAKSYDGADLVIVNTCGFIDAAVQESLDAIGEALNENGKVIVTGCLGAKKDADGDDIICLLYTSPSPRDRQKSRMPSSA